MAASVSSCFRSHCHRSNSSSHCLLESFYLLRLYLPFMLAVFSLFLLAIFSLFWSAIFSLFWSAIFSLFLSAIFEAFCYFIGCLLLISASNLCTVFIGCLLAVIVSCLFVLVGRSSHPFSIPVAFFIPPIDFLRRLLYVLYMYIYCTYMVSFRII